MVHESDLLPVSVNMALLNTDTFIFIHLHIAYDYFHTETTEEQFYRNHRAHKYYLALHGKSLPNPAVEKVFHLNLFSR